MLTLGLIFWIVMLIVLLGGGFYWRSQPFLPGFGVTWFLLFLLGWKVFGFPVSG